MSWLKKYVNNTGYLKGKKTNKNPINIIPSNHITTDNMAFPIYANGVLLYPNTGDYMFPTNMVVETPAYKSGGKSKYQPGGKIDPVKSYYNFLNPQPLEFNSGIPNFNLNSSIQYNPIPNYKNEEMDIYGDPDIDLINKSKSDYFNYLDSPQYLETAKKTWGSDANKYIDKQKQSIQNTPIVPYKNMKFWDQILYKNSVAHYDNVRKQILNYWGGDHVLRHELSNKSIYFLISSYDFSFQSKLSDAICCLIVFIKALISVGLSSWSILLLSVENNSFHLEYSGFIKTESLTTLDPLYLGFTKSTLCI